MNDGQTWDSAHHQLLRGEQVMAKRVKSAWAGFTGSFLTMTPAQAAA